jgi:hypothetical protein
MFADLGELVAREVAARAVQDDPEVSAGQDRRPLGDVLGPAEDIDVEVPVERLAQVVQPIARPGHEDPDALPHESRRLDAHSVLPSFLRTARS